MKQVIKTKIKKSLRFEKNILKVLKVFDTIYQYAYKCYLDHKIVQKYCKNELKIVKGIFSGMQYPTMETAGSAFGLKIVGIYEEELIPIFEQIINNSYKKVIDIGSAEGYYAIGLARRIKDIEVEAFDIDPYARKLLNKMRIINDVEKRVNIKTWCTKEVLMSMDFSKKSLIISDCEGYERELFDEETAILLQQVDILVEVHDDIETGKREIYDQIYRAFKETHDIEVVYSMSTAEKVCKHAEGELSKIFRSDELLVFMNEREWRMVWLFMKAKR